MKNIFVLIVAAMLIAFPVMAADRDSNSVTTLQNAGKVVFFSKVIGGTNTAYSNAFSFDGFIGESTITYPITVTFSQDSIERNAGAEVMCTKIILQGSNDPQLASGSWIAFDTLITDLLDTAAVTTTLNLNNIKYAWGRWAVTGVGANTAALPKVWTYLYRKDN